VLLKRLAAQILVPCIVFAAVLTFTGLPNATLRNLGERAWSENQAPVSLYATAVLVGLAVALIALYEFTTCRAASQKVWYLLQGPRAQMSGWLTTFSAMAVDLGVYVLLAASRPGLPPRFLGALLFIMGLVVGYGVVKFDDSATFLLETPYDATAKDARYWRGAAITVACALALMAGWIVLSGRAFSAP
jgi:hypothetical protein